MAAGPWQGALHTAHAGCTAAVCTAGCVAESWRSRRRAGRLQTPVEAGPRSGHGRGMVGVRWDMARGRVAVHQWLI